MTQKQPDEEIVDWQEEKIEATDERDTREKEHDVIKPTTPQARKDFFNDY